MGEIMKQKIWYLISLVTVFSILILGLSLYKLNPRNYLNDKESFIYANENIGKKNYNEVDNFFKKINVQVDENELKTIKNNVNNFYMVTYDPFIKPEKDFTCIIDLRRWYYKFFLEYDEYFNKEDNYYVLKDEILKKIRENGIYVGKIYMIPHRGNFLLSTSKKVILNQIENVDYQNNETIKILDQHKTENLGVFIVNFKKDSFYNFKNIYMAVNYKNNEMNPKLYLSFTHNKSEVNVGNENRKLLKYIKENRVYVYNNDFYNIFSTFTSALKIESQYMFLMNFLKINAGVEISKLLEDIDKELVYDIITGQGIIKLKNEENVKNLINNLEKSSIKINTPLKLKDNSLYIGEGELSEVSSQNIKLKNNQSFYLDYTDGEEKIKIENYSLDGGAEINIKLNDKVLENIIEKSK